MGNVADVDLREWFRYPNGSLDGNDPYNRSDSGKVEIGISQGYDLAQPIAVGDSSGVSLMIGQALGSNIAQSIAIGGSELLSTPDLMYDGFESGNMSGATTNTINFSWQSNNKTSVVTMDPISTAIWNNGTIYNVNLNGYDWTAKTGDNSLRFRYHAGDNWSEQRWDYDHQTDLWLSYWLKVPENYVRGSGGGGATNNKFLVNWCDGHDNKGEGSTFWLGMSDGGGTITDIAYAYTEGGGNSAGGFNQYTPFIDSATDQNRWMLLLVNIKMESSDGADDGVIQLFRAWEGDANFTTLLSASNLPIRVDDSDEGFKTGYLMGWANGTYADDTDFLVDDVSFYSSDPRI